MGIFALEPVVKITYCYSSGDGTTVFKNDIIKVVLESKVKFSLRPKGIVKVAYKKQKGPKISPLPQVKWQQLSFRPTARLSLL